MYAQIQPLCLAVPPGRFVTDEVWLVATNGYWVEAGFIDNNASITGLPTGTQLAFWFDHRPIDGSSHGHVLAVAPPLTNSTAWIRKTATDTYTIIFGPSNNYSGVSTNNSMNASNYQVGSESTSNATASFGYFRTMQYYTASGWHVPSPPIGVKHDTPQVQEWFSLYDTMNAGSPC